MHLNIDTTNDQIADKEKLPSFRYENEPAKQRPDFNIQISINNLTMNTPTINIINNDHTTPFPKSTRSRSIVYLPIRDFRIAG